MNRGIIYPGQIPLEVDLLYAQQQAMVGLSKLAAAIFGTSTVFNGLAVTQTTVASMNVQVAPGEIYQIANLEGTAYSSIAADTTHTILKQGINLDNTLLALTAPGTVGFSVNYLIQATFTETDSVSVVLPYYNASNPATAYSGPANSGAAQNTRRLGTVTLTAKAGVAATTGTQTTPAPDSGYVGISVVTVAYGAATVVNANISAYSSAPGLGLTYPTLSNGFGVSIGSSGWQKLPSGLILQWGSYGATTGALVSGVSENASISVTFPLTFPNACYSVAATPQDVSGAALQELTAVNAITTSGFGALLSCKQASSAMTAKYIAIGN